MWRGVGEIGMDFGYIFEEEFIEFINSLVVKYGRERIGKFKNFGLGNRKNGGVIF